MIVMFFHDMCSHAFICLVLLEGWVPSMLFFIYMVFHQLIENGFAQFNNYARIMFRGMF